MELASPVTILVGGKELAMDRLSVVIVDDSRAKSCHAHIRPLPKPLTLWAGSAYDQIGDYTQAHAEARILELLGSDIAAGLAALV